MRRTWLVAVDAMRLAAIFKRFAVVADASVVPRHFPEHSRLPLPPSNRSRALSPKAARLALPRPSLLSKHHTTSLSHPSQDITMSYYFTIIGTRDNPLFEHEFGTSKAGGDGVARFRSEARHMNQFIVHSSLDIVEEAQWGNNALYVSYFFLTTISRARLIDLEIAISNTLTAFKTITSTASSLAEM